MKVIVNALPAPAATVTLPRLLVNKNYGFVILNTEDRMGIVLSKGTSNHSIGKTLKWNLDNFEPFYGDIVLSNED